MTFQVHKREFIEMYTQKRWVAPLKFDMYIYLHTQKLLCSKGNTYSKPSFLLSMLNFRVLSFFEVLFT